MWYGAPERRLRRKEPASVRIRDIFYNFSANRARIPVVYFNMIDGNVQSYFDRPRIGGGDRQKRRRHKRRMIVALMIFAAVSQTPRLFAADDVESTYRFTDPRILNGSETMLYPKKVPVPGVLWGTNPGYKTGMVMLKVTCGVNDAITVFDPAEDDEVEAYAALFRVELYRYTKDDEWEYAGWYRFDGTMAKQSCDGLRAAAALAGEAKPLDVDLIIRSRGALHRNIVRSWELH